MALGPHIVDCSNFTAGFIFNLMLNWSIGTLIRVGTEKFNFGLIQWPWLYLAEMFCYGHYRVYFPDLS